MIHLEVKKIQIGEGYFPVKVTQRAIDEFEELSHVGLREFIRSVANGEPGYSSNLSKMFFCAAKAGTRAEKINFEFTYEQFLDATDDYYMVVIRDFAPFFFDQIKSTDPDREEGDEKKK